MKNPKPIIPDPEENGSTDERKGNDSNDNWRDDDLPEDPFDLANLRLSQDYLSGAGAKKIILTVPVRKPSKEWFIRTHHDPAYRIETAVIEIKEDSEIYLVSQNLRPELAAESTFGLRALFTAMNRNGDLFIWPIRIPGSDGRLDDWNKSALEAALLAREHWIRLVANRSLGAYDVYPASADWPDPNWTDYPFQELLRIAFKDKYIQSMDHPVLKRLRGEA